MSDECGGPFGWYCQVRERVTGKPWLYWVNNAPLRRVDVAAHVEKHYPHVVFVSCDPAITPPDGSRIRHVPPEHFQHGILKKIQEEMSAGSAAPARLPRRRIDRRRVL